VDKVFLSEAARLTHDLLTKVVTCEVESLTSLAALSSGMLLSHLQLRY